MKIIAGEKRGSALFAPKDERVRPTLGRVKEDIFNIINLSIRQSRFLDLFCGSGQMGIEALSRGAREVTFVDNHPESLALTKRNLEKTGFLPGARVLRRSAPDFLFTTKEKYDIIFLDPPYDYPSAEACIKTILERSLLYEGGLLILEQGKNAPWVEENYAPYITKIKTYAQSVVYFMRNKP